MRKQYGQQIHQRDTGPHGDRHFDPKQRTVEDQDNCGDDSERQHAGHQQAKHCKVLAGNVPERRRSTHLQYLGSVETAFRCADVGTLSGDDESDQRSEQPYLDRRDLLKRMLQAPRHSQPDHLNAAFAAYHLEDYALTVSEWEVASGNGKPGGPRELRADAVLAAAHAYRKLGRVEASDVILDEWERRVSSRIEDNPRPEPYLWYRHASVATIRGDRAAALRHIQRAIDEGWRQHWRPHVEPALAELRDDRDFQAKKVRTRNAHAGVMREQLAYDEALRAKWRG